uniref:SUEL-type lectin domain-containing protein n=1 Tax=Sinocyclocheilus grahami TaxID=75366 RepID=A0A672N028_SINGR
MYGQTNIYCKLALSNTFLSPGVDTKRYFWCEGGSVPLSCGYIKVITANYGRTDHTTCSTGRSLHQLSNLFSKLFCVCSYRCDGRKSCSVPAVNSVFSDPCVGTHKYLDVSYLCLPFSKYFWCEGGSVPLSCGYIKVITANYGRTDHTTCSTGRSLHQLSNVDCFQETSVQVICDGRKSCSVPAVNSVFSDPCVGTHKYLDVSYLCLPFSKSITDTHYHSKLEVGKMFLKEVSFAHQGCIYFVTVKL